MKRRFSFFLPAEWSLIAFLTWGFAVILLGPVELSHSRWEYFPSSSLFFVAVGALFYRTLKFSPCRAAYQWWLAVTLGLIGLAWFLVSPSFVALSPLVLGLGFLLLVGNRTDFLHPLRLIFPFLAIINAYPLIPILVRGLNLPNQDDLLIAADRFIFGTHPVIWLQNWIWPPASEILAAVYLSYGALILAVLALNFVKVDPKPLEESVFALTLTFAIGYFCYTLIPAIGPLYTQTFAVELGLVWLRVPLQELATTPRIDTDCFPSLHTAATLVSAWLCYRHTRGYFWFFFPFYILMPVACVYLRYHYVVDILAGLLLAGFIVWMTRLLYSGPSSAPLAEFFDHNQADGKRKGR